MSPPPVFPQALKLGDTIAIVAPAGVADAEKLQRAINGLHNCGFKTKTYRDVCSRRGYLAGSDAERGVELNSAFADSECQAIFPARGGYGCIRIVDQLDFDVVRANPKIFVGFSDNTVLHAALYREAGLVTFHGPHPCDSYGRADGPTLMTEEWLWKLVRGDMAPPCELAFESMESLRPGVAEGRIVGGNLALVCSLLGTNYEPDFDGNILLLEDTDEPPYRVDRFLAQLRLNGCFERVAGIVLGQFTNCDPPDSSPSLQLEDVMQDYLGEIDRPVLTGMPSGHGTDNVTLPLGVSVRLDCDRRCLTLLESSVVGTMGERSTEEGEGRQRR